MALKRIVLVVAIFSLSLSDLLSGSGPASTQPSRTKSRSPSSRARVAGSFRTVRSVRVRTRRRRRWNPWRVSSFGEPTLGDSAAGEDAAVRAAAVEAIGQWNGSMAVVDPNTGRILSIVNQKLALQSAFTPCSTFKPIVALGALKEGVITSETVLRVGRRLEMTLTDALARSNNPFFAKLGQRLGFTRVAQYAREFGLGEKAGWNIAGESAGSFPSAPPKVGVGLLSSHGEEIQITILQLAAVLSAIANGGTLYYLQYPRATEEIEQFHPMVRRRLEGFDDYFPHIKQGLAAAVIYGTGRQAYIPEEQIFGKTGTCSEDGARIGWFASYAAHQEPRYVVVVLLRGGRLMYGPHAAEIAGRFYREIHLREQSAAEVIPPPNASSLLPH